MLASVLHIGQSAKWDGLAIGGLMAGERDQRPIDGLLGNDYTCVELARKVALTKR